MSYEQSGYIPSPQPGVVPPPPEAPMPGVMPQPMPYQMPQPQPQPQPQPGAWPGQPGVGYAPAPMYVQPAPLPPTPSLFNSPAVLVSKLPLLALIGLGGFALVGVLDLVEQLVAGSGYHAPMGTYVLDGIGSLIEYVVLGVVWFAVLMTLKHFADQHESKPEPPA